ncbi:MAG TPA: hypothetical protein VEZ17_01725, partial [Chitinophagaceae bacterium]|nr:hypothetical protein [Chitinophagaceae bacterium]
CERIVPRMMSVPHIDAIFEYFNLKPVEIPGIQPVSGFKNIGPAWLSTAISSSVWENYPKLSVWTFSNFPIHYNSIPYSS